jgi:uncharacterized membrane protein
MSLGLTKFFGILVALLAVIGLFVSGHMFDVMNTDIALDVLRVVLAAGLLYIGYVARDQVMARRALLGVGILYILMGVAGIISPTLGGLLPSGLTGFDVVFHLVTGAMAAAVGASSENRRLAAH